MNSLTKKNISLGINPYNNQNTKYKNNTLKIENKVNKLHTLSLSFSQNNIKSIDINLNSIKATENNTSKDKKIKIIRKNKKNKKSESKYTNNKYNINYMKNLKFIQLWWKTIFQIIKIQKNIRAFLFRIKLMKYLDKSERIFNNILYFSKIIKKIICKSAFLKFFFQINKMKTIEISKSRKFINKFKNLKIPKNINIEKKSKNNSSKKYKKNNFNEIKNRIQKCNLEKRNDYNKDIYKSNKILNNTTIIQNQRNLITIINNTNNIYNNVYNKNNKLIIKKKSKPKKN